MKLHTLVNLPRYLKLGDKIRLGDDGFKSDNVDFHDSTYEQRLTENELHRLKAQEYLDNVGLNPMWLANLVKAGYHAFMGNPHLGGNSESKITPRTGIVPTPAKSVSAAQAMEKVKAMKAAKDAARLAAMTPRARRAAEIAKVITPKDLASSNLTRSGLNNINGILAKLPETERSLVTLALLLDKEFWYKYGDGIINVTPSRAAGVINGIRKKLGLQNGSSYRGLVAYGRLASGINIPEDATRLTTGIKHTTTHKPG